MFDLEIAVSRAYNEIYKNLLGIQWYPRQKSHTEHKVCTFYDIPIHWKRTRKRNTIINDDGCLSHLTNIKTKIRNNGAFYIQISTPDQANWWKFILIRWRMKALEKSDILCLLIHLRLCVSFESYFFLI